VTNPFVLLYLLVAFALPIAVFKTFVWLTRTYADDPIIDGLIQKNRERLLAAQAEKGMDKPDWQKINRAGGRVWQQTLQSQRRYNQISVVRKTG
jgi:hypothetical protein